MNGSSSGYWTDFYVFYSPHPAEERNIAVMEITPTASATRKIRQRLNRLLPKGRRCRGDVQAIV